MKRIAAAAAALALSLVVGACSAPSTSSTAGGAGGGGGAVSTGSSGTQSALGPDTKVDQSTPEQAMTSWFNALLRGDSKSVCSLMASAGTALEQLPDAVDNCGRTLAPMLDSVKGLGDVFSGLTISGATIEGDAATFASATTSPPVAKQVIAPFKGVRIGEKWYITR